MAIAVDASSFTLYHRPDGNNGTPTSSTPVADSLLVACVTTLTASGTTVTDTGGGLTWNKDIESTTVSTQIWTAYQATSLLRTVLADDNGGGVGNSLVCKTIVLTGAHPSAWVAQTTQGTTGANPTSISALTSSVDDSFTILVATDTNNNGASTSSDVEYAFDATDHEHFTVHLTGPTATSGTPVSFNVSSSPGATFVWVAIEIAPAVEAPPAAPTNLIGKGDLPGVVYLTWTAPAAFPAITNYDADFALASAPTSWLGTVSTSSTSTEFLFPGLENRTAYVFRVRGVNSEGDGDWSTTSASVTPDGPQATIVNTGQRRI